MLKLVQTISISMQIDFTYSLIVMLKLVPLIFIDTNIEIQSNHNAKLIKIQTLKYKQQNTSYD